jgi:hypothetical protein
MYQFEASSDTNGFKLSVISKGYRQLVGGVLTDIKGTDGKRIARPSLLTSAGAVTTTPYVQTFYPHRVVNWGTSPF